MIFMARYISKVTGAGQITLPKKIRDALRVREGSFIIVEEYGGGAYIRALNADEKTMETIRRKIKKSGVSKAEVDRIVEEERERLWEESYAQALHRH